MSGGVQGEERGVACLFARMGMRAWNAMVFEVINILNKVLHSQFNREIIPISNTSFLHMTQETSHYIYSISPLRFDILDVLSKQYPE